MDSENVQAIKKNGRDLAITIGDILFSGVKTGMYVHKILLVGDDIDIFNFQDIIWAYSACCRPDRDGSLSTEAKSFAIVPFVMGGSGLMKGGKAV